METERLEFTRDMLKELEKMALAERRSLLAYLIRMAIAEARDAVRERRKMKVA